MTTSPLSPSERVKRSTAALIAKGGRRMPSGHLQPAAAQALADLEAAGASPLTAISDALIAAQKRLKKSQKKAG